MKWRYNSRLPAIIFSLVILVLLLSPISQNWNSEPQDDFPLSYYPMFTKVRRERTYIYHPIGFQADGTVVNLSYRLAGSGGMNHMRRQMRRIVRAGYASDLCERVMKEVAASDKPELASIEAVAIVRSRYNIDAYFQGDRQPVKRKEHARMTVERTEGET